MKTIFLSHANEDSEIALQLVAQIEGLSSFLVWRYESDYQAGDSYLLVTRAAIDACPIFLLLITPASVKSHQVEVEIEHAFEQKKKIIPVLFGISDAQYKQSNPLFAQIMGTKTSVCLGPESVALIARHICASVTRELTPRSSEDEKPPSSGSLHDSLPSASKSHVLRRVGKSLVLVCAACAAGALAWQAVERFRQHESEGGVPAGEAHSAIAVSESIDASVPFRNWWNYYQYGIACRDSGDHVQAAACFRKAMGLSAGARYGNDRELGVDRESMRIRTYGVHFLENYFPNRELGIALYNLKDYTAAIGYLSKSTNQYPSDRALLYLMRARSLGKPPTAPRIVFDSSVQPKWLNAEERLLHGWIIGDSLRGEVSINGVDAYAERTTNGWEFVRTIRLQPGVNSIVVEAGDTFGQVIRNTLLWGFDARGPLLDGVRTRREDALWHLQAVCKDTAGIKEVRVNGLLQFQANPSQEVAIAQIDLLVPSESDAAVEAWDLAGNRAQYDIRGPVDAAKDQSGPSIRVAEEAIPVVDRREYLLDLTVWDSGRLRSVFISGEAEMSEDDVGVERLHRDILLALGVGTNTFLISATDMAGNVTNRPFTVVRKELGQVRAELLPAMVLFPIVGGDADNGLGPRVQNEMVSSLSAHPLTFRILEPRTPWNEVMAEAEISVSEVTNTAVQAKLGRLVGADCVLSYQVFPEGKGATITAEVVKEGVSICKVDVFCEDASDLTFAVRALSLKIRQGMGLLDQSREARPTGQLSSLGSRAITTSGRPAFSRESQPSEPDV